MEHGTYVNLRTASGTVAMPRLGFGVWQMADLEVVEPVRAALDAGYRSIDTAALYRNEAGVARAIAASGIPREEIFLTSKVWNTDHGRDRTLAAFDATLERLEVEVLDLYLIHWPVPSQDRYVETWRALQELRDAGRVIAIGVSNFEPEHLKRLADETGEWPAINQVELHPYLQQAALREFGEAHGIVTEAWSPLSSGKLVLADPVIAGIAREQGATPAQVIIAWHLAIGNVVIPKSVTASRIVENFEAARLSLTPDQVEQIAALDRGQRTGPDPRDF